MRMTLRELREMMCEARKQYSQLPDGVKLYGADRPMDEGERLALSHLMATARFLNSAGCIKETRIDDLDPELEQPDSDTTVD